MRKLLRSIAIIAVCGAACTSTANEEADVRELLQQYARSVNELDLGLAEQLWSKRQHITFIHPRGHQRGWEDIRQAFYLDTMGRLPERHLTLKDISVQVLDDSTAWVEFYWDFVAKLPDGKPLKSAGRETQILRREADGWKIVHVHYSGMPTQAEGEGF